MPALHLFQPVREGGDPAPVLRGVARSLDRLLPASPGEPLPSAWDAVLSRLRGAEAGGPDRA